MESTQESINYSNNSTPIIGNLIPKISKLQWGNSFDINDDDEYEIGQEQLELKKQTEEKQQDKRNKKVLKKLNKEKVYMEDLAEYNYEFLKEQEQNQTTKNGQQKLINLQENQINDRFRTFQLQNMDKDDYKQKWVQLRFYQDLNLAQQLKQLGICEYEPNCESVYCNKKHLGSQFKFDQEQQIIYVNTKQYQQIGFEMQTQQNQNQKQWQNLQKQMNSSYSYGKLIQKIQENKDKSI